MLREAFFLFISFLQCQKTLNAISTDINAIAKLIENNFKFVIHDRDFTIYLNKNMSLSMVPAMYRSQGTDYVDWREKEMVGPVRDQQHCSACWAFSSVACIESHLAIRGHGKNTLSDQFLIDCIRYGKPDAPKCGHYPMLKAFSDIVTEFGGVLAGNDYRPYTATAGRCTYHGPPPYPLPVTGFVRVAPNEDAMVRALYHGPISAAINSKSMEKYKNGDNYIDEPTEKECSSKPENMNHAVLIVGFSTFVGESGSVPYWIIKNSWGTNWGDRGYYYLLRGRNACGIANDVSYAIVPSQ